MSPRHLLLSLSVIFSVLASHADAAAKLDMDRISPVPVGEEIPVMDFFRAPLLVYPRVNEAGTHVAALVTTPKDKMALLVFDLEKQETQSLTGAGDRDVYSFDWLNNSRLVYSVSKEKLYGEGVYVADLEKFRLSHPVIERSITSLVGVPENNRERPLFFMQADIEDGDGRKGQVIQVDTNLVIRERFGAANAEMLDDYLGARARNDRHILKTYPEPEGGLVWRYLPDKDGELAFGFTSRDGISTMHRLAEGRWEKCPIDLDLYRIESYGEKPGEVIVSGPDVAGTPRPLLFMDAATGQPGETLLADQGYDYTGWVYRHPVTDQILGVSYERNGPKMLWFAEAYRSIQKTLEGFFPGLIVRIIGSDRGERHFFVSVYSDRHPATYYRVDLEKRALGLVKATRPWIDPTRMQPMSMLKFKTADGRTLDAYVTLPAGASKEKPAPLVVLPHGGPWVRDTWGFHGEAQFLASHGFAVLQPNYRGSTGYDWMFPYEDRWAFRKMHDDVTAATKTLLASGLVDRTRVAIMGASFGAYLALSGAVHEPDLYHCAVTIAGVFDWERVMQDEKFSQYDNPEFAILKRRLGDPKQQQEKFEAISPLRHVENARVPFLVAHGKEDSVAAVAESRRLISELERNNIPHEALFFSGEGHGMGYLKNQVELYTRILAFLNQHLAARAAATPP